MTTRDAEADMLSGTSGETGILWLEISRIKPYEHNPRHVTNPEYDRIKASIRDQGLDQPLIITRRPGSEDYIVHSGGNTRLHILKALYAETADERFSKIPCLFKPWSRESEVLLAHLRENDLRGSLTFIDKARAVLETRQLLEQELGLDAISLRGLEAELRNAGYRISNSAICLMAYAAETLWGLIPLALEAGMGKHQVGRIRALERAARNLWQGYEAGDETSFNEVFATLCRRYDGPDWDTDSLQSALETEIAETAEASIQTIRVAFDAEFQGRELEIPEFVPLKEPPKPVPRDNAAEDPMSAPVRESHEADESPFGQTTDPLENPFTSDIASPEEVDHSTSDAVASPMTENLTRPTDIKSLRGRAWTLATRLAQRHGLGDLIMPLPSLGLGFVLRDIPDPGLADQLDEDTLARLCMLWWQLAACAEMTFAPLEAILPILPADSLLRRALDEQDGELLFRSIWTLDPGHTGYRVWQALPERDWRDLIELMETYRQLRHRSVETGEPIWA